MQNVKVFKVHYPGFEAYFSDYAAADWVANYLSKLRLTHAEVKADTLVVFDSMREWQKRNFEGAYELPDELGFIKKLTPDQVELLEQRGLKLFDD